MKQYLAIDRVSYFFIVKPLCHQVNNLRIRFLSRNIIDEFTAFPYDLLLFGITFPFSPAG
ncbi:MAG: hypothetical protein LIO63_03865 [Akkermansia sp.]|nr:hypothetical protein [Akkermansia sp.]